MLLVVAWRCADTVRRGARTGSPHSKHRHCHERNPDRVNGSTADCPERRTWGRRSRPLFESLGDNGNTVTGTASYTVSNLRPVTPSAYADVKGTLYAVDVTVQSQTGTTLVHPWNFVMRTEDGTSLTPVLGGVDNELPAHTCHRARKSPVRYPSTCRQARPSSRLCCRMGSAATN